MLVYTAIAKVANTSIKSALLQSFSPDVSRRNPHAAEVPYQTVHPARVGAEVPTYLHFAVVRNPFDRFVSFWADKIDGDGMTGGLEQLGFRKGMSFGDAVRLAASIPDDKADPHMRSQTFLLTDQQGRLRPDLLLRFERLVEDWNLLRYIVTHRTGTEIVPLPHRRVSDHQRYLDYYDEESTRLVHSRYAKDFDLLNYKHVPVRRRRVPIDDDLDRALTDRPKGAGVLDLTPPTADRINAVQHADGQYLAPARHNQLGQLARFTALEQDRVPPEAFDILIVDDTASRTREPHRAMRESFERSGRPVLVDG